MDENKVTYFAQTDSRNKKVSFGIKAKDRTRHMYVIGKTGMGKSTLLENMAVQDIKNGEGMAFIDPHGKTADLLLEYVPEHRMKDVVYFAPFDTDFPISFNVLESVDPDKRHLVVAGLMSTFKKIWQDAWSARMEYILTNTLLALLEYPNATLLGVNRMLSEKEFRKDVISHVTDVSVRNFWVQEFANYTERMAAEAVPAIQNKIGQFTANALIRNLIGQPVSSFDMRKAMDERKIIIINLSKGRIGESNANLLGGMMITKIYLAAMSRADVPDRALKLLPNFYLFVDEFQNFANESFADILSEARKYKLNLTIAHQYVEQMEEEVQAAVFGNVGTMIAFRVGATDAELLEKEFLPQFTQEDIVNLGFAQIYLRLMIDGIGSAPFSAVTLGPIKPPEVSLMTQVIDSSRAQFARPRAEVEREIEAWMNPIKAPRDMGRDGGRETGRDSMPSGQGSTAGQYPPRQGDRPPQQSQAPQQYSRPPMRAAQPVAPRPSVAAAPSIVATPSPIRRAEPQPVPRPTSTQRPAAPTTEVKKPFAEAFQALKVETPPQKQQMPPVQPARSLQSAQPVVPISLASLVPKRAPQLGTSALAPTPTANKKDQTPERVNDLKNALAALVKKAPVPSGTAPLQKQAQPQPVAQKPEAPQKPQEIPEHVLRNVLDSELDVDRFEDR